jgi:pectinesterase inhibitor-like protein
MATARALAPILAFFLLANTAPAARTVTDMVQDMCSKTQFPKVCVGRLTPIVEGQKASPRLLAEQFVNVAAQGASGMAAFVHTKLGSAKDDDAVFKCYDSCSDEVEEAVAHLNGCIREPTDSKFLELRSWLSSTLGGASACEDACRDAPQSADKDEVVKYSVDIEKLLRITLDLITEASGSMSADIALPPTDAAAPASYGAAFGGSPAEAPGPSSSSALLLGGAADVAPVPSVGSAEEATGPSVASPPVTEGPAPSVAASDGPADAPASDAPPSDAPAPSSDAEAKA